VILLIIHFFVLFAMLIKIGEKLIFSIFEPNNLNLSP